MEAPCFKVTMAWKHNCEASSSKQTHQPHYYHLFLYKLKKTKKKKKRTFCFLFPLVPSKTVGSVTQILMGMYIIPMILPPRVSVHHHFSAKTGNIRTTTRRCHDAMSSAAGVVVIYLSSCNKRNTENKGMKRAKSNHQLWCFTWHSSYASLASPSAGFSFARPLPEMLRRPSKVPVPSSSHLQ